MDTTLGDLRKHAPQVADHLAQARSAANLRTRRTKEREEEVRVGRLKRATQRKLRDEAREAASWFRGRIRVRVDEPDQPRIGVRTARKLHSRDDPNHITGPIGKPVFTGADGCRSLHFRFLARGLAGSKGKPWVAGEATRKLQYIGRYEALEDGLLGHWSNIAEDRAELTAFGYALEALERHDRKNANVFCEEIIELPCELTAAQRREWVRHICLELTFRGLPFAVGIHKPDPKGDQRNFHCHLVYSLRPAQRIGDFEWAFGLQKVPDINTPDGIRARRQAVTASLNNALEKAGSAKRYTEKAHAARGIVTQPGWKRGPALTAIYRRQRAKDEVVARQEAMTAALEKKIGDAQGIARMAGEAADLLEWANAQLEVTSAAVRACASVMLDVVQFDISRATESAAPARDAIDKVRHHVIAQVQAASGKLEGPRASIHQRRRLVRSAIAIAKIEFSQVDRPEDIERGIRWAEARAQKAQAPAPAITEQGNIAVDSSDPTHMPQPEAVTVSSFKKTPEGHVSIVDIGSLDNEVAKPPAPAPSRNIGRAAELTIDQSPSDDSVRSIDEGEVGDGGSDSDATTPPRAEGGANNVLAPLQSSRREITSEKTVPTPTVQQPKEAASRKLHDTEGSKPVFSVADLQAEEAAKVKRKAEERAKAEAEEKARLAVEANARTETEAQARRETEATQAEAKRLSEEKAADACAAEAGDKRQAAEEQAPDEAEAPRQAAAARRASIVVPATPAEQPATSTSKPLTAPPVPELSRQAAVEPVRNTAGNRLTPDDAAVSSRRTASAQAQIKSDPTEVRGDLVKKLDPALRGSPSSQPVQPEVPAPVQPIQQPRTIDDLSREELDSICNKLVAKEVQIRADAAGIPVCQFKAFPLADQIQLGRGAGLPHHEEAVLAAMKVRLRKLPMVAPPVSVSEPARPTVPSPTPPQPAPKPPINDEFEGKTQRQIDNLRSRGFDRG